MKAIEIQALTKLYGKSRGVENLSFSIEAGEVFGYLGPNGSGKTTTIRCLMGLLRPTSGFCRIFDQKIIPGLATQHRDIGYLPGDFRLWSGRTVRQSLKLMAALGKAKNTRKKREELAEKLNLNMDRPFGALSKGNRQKVGIVNAFQHQPKLYILDEPTIGLDPLIRMVVLDLIREVTNEGATVLLSSHDLSEVVAACRRAAILRDGRLVELSPISKIIHEGTQQLKIWFIEGSESPSIQTTLPDGVKIIQQDGDWVLLSYSGAADRVMKWLAQFPIDRITTPETTLEDAFIHYYKKQEADYEN